MQTKLWIEASSHNWKTASIPTVQHLEPFFPTRMTQACKKMPQITCHAHLILHLANIPLLSKPEQLVELYVRATRGSAKIQRERVRRAAQVSHRCCDMRSQTFSVSEDNPAGSTDRFSKFVTRPRHRQDILQTKVKRTWGAFPAHLLEWCNEASTCAIDVDTNLPTHFRIEQFNFLVNFPDGIIHSVVMITHDTNYSDGLLITERHKIMSVDSHLIINKIGFDDLGFNVKEPEELLPSSLENRADHEVWANTKNLLIGEPMLLLVPLSPAEFQGKTSKKAPFSRAHCTSARVVPSFRRYWSIPHTCNHVDDTVMKFNGCRID
mmetsp:Transcript_24150/g.39299  ORF Transcript_24150/g.39299 Transcript_24150/m.39299 type:complete len:322 (-) Transcript_24150:807-1772(-)